MKHLGDFDPAPLHTPLREFLDAERYYTPEERRRCRHGVNIVLQGCFDCIEDARRAAMPRYRWSHNWKLWVLSQGARGGAPLELYPAVLR